MIATQQTDMKKKTNLFLNIFMSIICRYVAGVHLFGRN